MKQNHKSKLNNVVVFLFKFWQGVCYVFILMGQ